MTSYWTEDGAALSREEMLAAVMENLDWLDKDDPAYAEQEELLRELLEEED